MIPAIVGVEIVKQLFKWGGSGRKEAISIGVIGPAVVTVMTQYQECGGFNCVTPEAWGGLAVGIAVLLVHLNAKRKDEITEC